MVLRLNGKRRLKNAGAFFWKQGSDSLPNIVINSYTLNSNEDGIVRVRLTKAAQPLSNVILVRGDSRSQIIEMDLTRRYGGVDMSTLTYAVNVVNADGDRDVFMLELSAVTNEKITLSWPVHGVATAAAGITRFEVEAIDQNAGNTIIWQSGIMSFKVTEDLGNIPDGAQEQELSNLQSLILYVNEKLPDILRFAETGEIAEASRVRAEADRVSAEQQREESFLTFSYGFTVVDGKLCVKYGEEEEPAQQGEEEA